MAGVVSCLIEQGQLVSYEPLWPLKKERSFPVPNGRTNGVAEILANACRELSGYTWRQEGARYHVFPEKGAFSETAIPPITVSNTTLFAVIDNTALRNSLDQSGVLLSVTRSQSKLWREIYLSIDFPGGRLSNLLDALSDRIGKNVCWSIEFNNVEPMRILVGNEVVVRPQFTLAFHSLTGERVRSMRELLISADVAELKRLLEQKTGAPPSKVAFELASRYWHAGNMEGATNFLQRAEDLSMSEEERWQLRYATLSAGFGYPTPLQATQPIIDQYEAFLNRCSYVPARWQALWWLLKERIRLGQEDKARILIQSASPQDIEWQYDAAQYFQSQYRNGEAIKLPQRIHENAPTGSVIRTTVNVERTADGKLKGHKETEKIDVPAQDMLAQLRDKKLYKWFLRDSSSEHAKELGRVCLQSNLSRDEIISLMGPPLFGGGSNGVAYSFAPSQLLEFQFDAQGKIIGAKVTGVAIQPK